MPKDRQKQIEVLATKLFGWESGKVVDEPTGILCTAWVQNDEFCALSDWNPFENTADCEMVKAKICKLGFYIQTYRGENGATCVIYMIKRYNSLLCKTEYEAVCLAALQLPECKEK